MKVRWTEIGMIPLKLICSGVAAGAVVSALGMAKVFWALLRDGKHRDSLVTRRKLASLNVFGSGRDLRLFSAIVVGFGGAFYGLACLSAVRSELLQAGFIGSLAGAVAMMQVVLPVRCSLRPGSRDAFLRRIRELGYRLVEERDGVEVHLPATPHWTRWDSNRVVLYCDANTDVAICPMLIVSRL